MARPKSFDKGEIIDIAMEAFWTTGFSSTGIATLVEKMGLKPSSLYSAFGSKEALFLEVLNRYSEISLSQIDLILNSATSPLAGVQNLLNTIAMQAVDSVDCRGCLLVNTLLDGGCSYQSIQEATRAHLAKVESLIIDRLHQAQEQGELDAVKDIESMSALFMTILWGLRVLARTNPEQTKVNAILTQAQVLFN